MYSTRSIYKLTLTKVTAYELVPDATISVVNYLYKVLPFVGKTV